MYTAYDCVAVAKAELCNITATCVTNIIIAQSYMYAMYTAYDCVAVAKAELCNITATCVTNITIFSLTHEKFTCTFLPCLPSTLVSVSPFAVAQPDS